MAEFFLELFSEEIPANLQQNFREKLLEEFREYFINKSIKYSGRRIKLRFMYLTKSKLQFL